MRWTATLLLLASACAGSSEQRRPGDATTDIPARPQLMLVVVIDQLGSETFRKLEPLLSPRGALRRIAQRGRLYEEVAYGYAATYTAPGHAAIHTGAVPRDSGVTSNFWIERRTGRARAVVDDGQHPVLGVPDAHAGPDALRVPTLADTLDGYDGGQGKVVSISLKDRAAVIPGGKSPDLALWYEAKLASFTTSTYYADELPAWLQRYQQAHPTHTGELVWDAAGPARLLELLGPDAAPGEGAYDGLDTSFPHRLSDAGSADRAWRIFPHSSEYLVDLALEAARALELGRDDHVDLLALSLSGTDYAGHVYGPDSWEYADHLRRADLALARMIDTLAARTRLSVLITSDHGVAPLPERRRDAHSAARVTGRVLVAAAGAAIEGLVGPGTWVAGFSAPYLFLTPEALAHARSRAIRRTATEALTAQPGVLAAYDTSELEPLKGSEDPVEQRVLASVHPETSGEVFVVTRQYVFPEIGVVPGHGTTHGSPWHYDTNVPVWVLAPGVHGPRVRETLAQQRVAVTIAALMGMPAPSGAADVPPLPGVAAP
jgi:arylsulfatase A-like enzyme